MPRKLTEAHLILPELNENGWTALRQWREDKGITSRRAAERLGISVATYYRYESNGQAFDIGKANHIVQMTGGVVRYRDLVGGFKPEYA